MNAAPMFPPTAIEPGRALERPMTAQGPPQEFTFTLAAGEFTAVTVDQRGIDVALRLTRGAEEETYVDSPTGRQGTETVVVLAEAAGEWRLVVEPADPHSGSGMISVTLDEPRMATAEDREGLLLSRRFAAGEQFRRQGDWAQAISAYRDARAGWIHRKDALGAATAGYRLAWVLDASGQADAAIGELEAAREDAAGLGTSEILPAILQRLGGVRLARWELDEAEACYRGAHEAFRQLGDELGLAASQDGLGRIAKDRGRFEESRELLRAARAGYRASEALPEELDVLISLGDLEIFAGRLMDARAIFSELRELAPSDEPTKFGPVASLRLGAIAHREGCLEEAQSLLEVAREGWRALNAARPELGGEAGAGAAATLNSLGTVYLKKGDLPRAREMYQKAFDLSHKTSNLPEEATAQLNLGRVAFEEGQYAAAQAAHEASLRLFEQTPDLFGLLSNRYGIARALFHQGRYAEAERELEHVLDGVERLRMEVGGLETRASYLASKQDYWELYIATLMAQHAAAPQEGFDQRGLEAVERFRARSLRDLLASADTMPRSGTSPPLVAELNRVRDELRRLTRQRLGAGGTRPTSGALARLDHQERSLIAELERLQAKQRRESPQDADQEAPAPFDLAAAQRLLDQHTAFLVYSLGPRQGFLWVVQSDRVATFPLAGRDEIDRLALVLATNLATRTGPAQQQADAAAQRLAELVLQPGRAVLAGVRRFVVVPDGSLARVPFGFLPLPWRTEDPPKRLIELREVVYTPSLAALARLRERRTTKRLAGFRQVAVVADPVFQPGDERLAHLGSGVPTAPLEPNLTRSLADLEVPELRRLPGTAREAAAILDHFPNPMDCKALTGFEADHAALMAGGLRGYRIVHFSTHALVHPRHPELSGLVLSLFDPRGAPRQGFLALHDIYQLPLDAQLVVLSACDTAGGKVLAGEGVLGLARGFFAAGADQVVASLWPVDDRGTAAFMTRFYAALLAGESAPTALGTAQRASLAEPGDRHSAAVWASFIALGDWDLRRPPKDSDIEPRDVGGAPPPPRLGDGDFPPPKPPKKEKDPPDA